MTPETPMSPWPLEGQDGQLRDEHSTPSPDTLTPLEGRPVGLDDPAIRNAVNVCNLMAAINMAHVGPRADLDVLRAQAERVERLFDNASKVAGANEFGRRTSDQCAGAADAIRTAIVELERYRALDPEAALAKARVQSPEVE
jgi:hypothetical protein